MGLDREKINALIYNAETALNHNYKDNWVAGVPLRKEEEDAKDAMEASAFFVSKFLHQDDISFEEYEGVMYEEPEFEEDDKVSIEELEVGVSGVARNYAKNYTKVLNKYQNRVEKDSLKYQQLNKQRALTAAYDDVITRINGYAEAERITKEYEEDAKRANAYMNVLEGIKKFGKELKDKDEEEFRDYEMMNENSDYLPGSEINTEPFENVYQNQYKRVMEVYDYTEKVQEVDFEEELKKLNTAIREKKAHISFASGIEKLNLEEYMDKSLKELEDLTNQDLHEKYQKKTDDIAKDAAKNISKNFSPYVIQHISDVIDSCIKGKEGYKTEEEMKAKIINHKYDLYNNKNADINLIAKYNLAEVCWNTAKEVKKVQQEQIGEKKRVSILKELADMRVLEAKKNALIALRKDDYKKLCERKIDEISTKPEENVREQLLELSNHLSKMHKTGRMNTTEYKEFKKALLDAAQGGDIDKAYEKARKYIEEKTAGGKEPSSKNGQARLSVARAVYAIAGTYARNDEFYRKDILEMKEKITPIKISKIVDGREVEQKDLIEEIGKKYDDANKKIEELSKLERELNPEEKAEARKALVDRLVKGYIDVNLKSPKGRDVISQLKINDKMAETFIDEFKKKIETKGMIPPAHEITKENLKPLSERDIENVIFGQPIRINNEPVEIQRNSEPAAGNPVLERTSVLGNH